MNVEVSDRMSLLLDPNLVNFRPSGFSPTLLLTSLLSLNTGINSVHAKCDSHQWCWLVSRLPLYPANQRVIAEAQELRLEGGMYVGDISCDIEVSKTHFTPPPQIGVT